MLWAKSCIDVFCMKNDEYKMAKQGTRKSKLADVRLVRKRKFVQRGQNSQCDLNMTVLWPLLEVLKWR